MRFETPARLRRIAVVTTNRADFGLLSPVIHKLNKVKTVDLSVLVTGNHLNKKFGETISEVKQTLDLNLIELDIQQQGTKTRDVSNALANCINLFTNYFESENLDLIVLLGDRFETLGVAIASTLNGLPIAHIHGGEITQGAIDDAFRHSITKMSHLHFAAHAEYRDRIIQLGEVPDRVFMVGSLGVENALTEELLPIRQLSRELGFEVSKNSLLVTIHPETISSLSIENQISPVLEALSKVASANVFVTSSNSDAGGEIINEKLRRFCEEQPNRFIFESLGHKRYLSLLRHVDAIVGNSSSGIIEAPALGTKTINIGTRQNGRVRANTVVDVGHCQEQIHRQIKNAFSKSVHGRFGIDDASSKPSLRITEVLTNHELQFLVYKNFYSAK